MSTEPRGIAQSRPFQELASESASAQVRSEARAALSRTGAAGSEEQV